MSAQTISLRLPEEEVAILNLLSDRERRTKTQIIREALQPLFRKVLDEPGERQKFCVHGIIGARQTGASNEHEHQTQFS